MRQFGKWVLSLGLVAATPDWPLASARADEAVPAAPSAKSANQATAEQIAAALQAAKQQGQLVGYDLDIEFKNGIATLKGSVTEPRHKDVATRAVQSVPGVRTVDNQLKIGSRKQAKKPARSSGVVTAAHEEAGPSDRSVQQVSHQMAYVAPQQQQPAAPSVPTPRGAVQTTSAQVSGPTTAIAQPLPAAGANPNQEAAERIAGALSAANMDGYDIEVRYSNGTAILQGSVPTMAQRAQAEAVARQVAGVNAVQNRLVPAQQPQYGPQGQPYAPQGQMGYPGQPAPYGYHPASYRQGGDPMQGAPAHGGAMQGAPMQGGPGYGSPSYGAPVQGMSGPPAPLGPAGGDASMYNMPNVPDMAWPSYAQYPNSAAVTYPQQYSASAWPYIGPFYPYPQVPLGWRKASLEWDDGQWNLKFNSRTDKWWWFLSPKNW